MMARVTTGITLVGALLMQGCAIAPGMTMTEPAELPEGEVVRVQTLTMDLLDQLEAKHASEVREVIARFGYVRTTITWSGRETSCKLRSGTTLS